MKSANFNSETDIGSKLKIVKNKWVKSWNKLGNFACREVADGFLSKKLCSVAALSMVGNMMLFCKFCTHYPTTLT